MPNYGYFDFSSGVNLLANPLSSNDNGKSLEWADSENVELQGYNGIRKMKGNSVFLDISTITGKSCKILALSEYRKNRDKFLVFVYADETEAYLCITDLDSPTLTVVRKGMDKSAKYNLEPYSNGIIVSNGVANSFIYFHEEIPNIIKCKTFEAYGIYPVDIKVHKGKLYAFNDDKEGILYYSSLGNPSIWEEKTDGSGGGFFSTIAGSDKPIRGLGTFGDALAIHRDKQTILLTGGSEDDFLTTPFSNLGSLSARGIINYDNKQYFYDDGIFALQYSSLQQIQLSSEFSRLISPAFVAMNPNNFKNMIAIPFPPNRQIWFFMSDSLLETDELNIVWIMDRKDPKKVTWYRRRALPVICACTCINKIYTGTLDGKILLENDTDTLCGKDFNGYWKSIWLKFGTLKLKSVEEGLDVGFGDVSTGVTLEYRFNLNESKVKSRLIIPTTGKTVKRRNVPGIFKSIQIGIKSIHDFALNSLSFYDISIEE